MVLVILMEKGNEESANRRTGRIEQQPSGLPVEGIQAQASVSHPLLEWGSVESIYPASHQADLGFEAGESDGNYDRGPGAIMQDVERTRLSFPSYQAAEAHEMRSSGNFKEANGRLMRGTRSEESKGEEEEKHPQRDSSDRLIEQLQHSFADDPHHEDHYYGEMAVALAPTHPFAHFQTPAALGSDRYPPPYIGHPEHSTMEGHLSFPAGVPIDSYGAETAQESEDFPLITSPSLYHHTPTNFYSGFPPTVPVARSIPTMPPAVELTRDRFYPSDAEISGAKHERDRRAIIKWYDRFRELLAFKDEVGHCSVPQKYPRNKQLGSWVNKMRDLERQRKQGKRNFLNDRMWENLRLIGFVSAKPKGDPLWMIRYNQFKDYVQTHQHANVPTKYAQNRALGRWVSTQRLQYRHYIQGHPSSMTDDRIRMLEELSFVWDAAPDRDGAQDERFADGSSNEEMT